MKYIKYILRELRDWVECFVNNMPGLLGQKLRNNYWKQKLGKCKSLYLSTGCIITGSKNISVGSEVRIMQGGMIYAHEGGCISLGNHVSLNSNVMIGAAENGEIIVGNDVLIGPNVVMRASNHKFTSKDVPINQQGHTGGKIIIEDDVWIGSNVVILPNVTVGKGSVIGAGAIVNRNIPPNSLAGGVPAKVIRENIRR